MDGWLGGRYFEEFKTLFDGWMVDRWSYGERRGTNLQSSITNFEIWLIFKILPLNSQDHWTYSMRSAHNRLWGRVCMLISCFLISILKNVCGKPSWHWMLWSLFNHWKLLNIKRKMINDCTWRSFRIDCDPVSETWWWTAEEDPEVFKLSFWINQQILCLNICQFYLCC